MVILIGLIVLLVVGFLFYISIKNGLIGAKNGIDFAKGSLDAMLKKRFDLIPNLVATVKEYSNYEAGTLERLVELRTMGMQNKLTDEEAKEFNTSYNNVGRSFMALAENYPNLKASENYLQLQGTLNETEEQIAAARRSYNAAINFYNDKIEMFPGSLFASGMGLQRISTPTITAEESQNVSVKNLFNS